MLLIRLIPLPNTNSILINNADTMQRHVMAYALAVDELKKEMVIRIKAYLLQWYSNDAVSNAVKIADFKITPGKRSIPVYAVKQLLDRLHGMRSCSSCGKCQISLELSLDYVQLPFQGLSGSHDPSCTQIPFSHLNNSPLPTQTKVPES